MDHDEDVSKLINVITMTTGEIMDRDEDVSKLIYSVIWRDRDDDVNK